MTKMSLLNAKGRFDDVMRYLTLLKIRIALLFVFTAESAYILTVRKDASLSVALFLALSTMLASMAGGALNHYFDLDIDGKMKRTSLRPLPMKMVKNPSLVLTIALALLGLSMGISSYFLNYTVSFHLFGGVFFYIVIYTLWLKRRSWVNIIVGGLAGSFAVLAGGASATPDLCVPPALMAIVLFLWTPSHFWSFAIVHKEDYRRAGVPMLPLIVGDQKTAVYIFVNTLLLVFFSLLPALMGYLGFIYFFAALGAGAFFLYRNVQLLRDTSPAIAWLNFKASMTHLSIILMAIIFDIFLLPSK
ncbi:MAG: protoheme IX farnesyltransferase [Nitrospinae bacterium]|nr:protoheme IX farnesyltransferase [Nitrospinota bacterium]